MPELELVLSETFAPENAEATWTELGEYLKVGEPRLMVRRAVDPTSVIQLLGDALDWLPLTAAATVYLSTSAKLAAGATTTPGGSGSVSRNGARGRGGGNPHRPQYGISRTIL